MCLTLITLCPWDLPGPFTLSQPPLSLDLTTKQVSVNASRADPEHEEHPSAPGTACAQSTRGSDVSPFHWDSGGAGAPAVRTAFHQASGAKGPGPPCPWLTPFF